MKFGSNFQSNFKSLFKSAFAIRLHEYDHIDDHNKCLWLQVVSYNCLPHSNFDSIEVGDQYYVHWALTETLRSEVFHGVILSIFAYVFIKRLYKLQWDLIELFVTYWSKECWWFLPFPLEYLSFDGTWMTSYSIGKEYLTFSRNSFVQSMVSI